MVSAVGVWETINLIWTFEKYFGITAIIVSLLVNWYMFLWALQGWGVIKLDPWLYDIVFFLDSEDGKNVFILTWADDIL